MEYLPQLASEPLAKLLAGLSLTEEVSLRLLLLPWGWSCHPLWLKNLGFILFTLSHTEQCSTCDVIMDFLKDFLHSIVWV